MNFNLPNKPKVRLKPAPPDRRQIAVIPIRALIDKELSGGCVRVLALLCSYCNRAGITWVGQDRLAKDLQTTRQYINNQLSILKKKNYVKVLVRGTKHSHTSTTRVIYNETINTEDAIGAVNEDVRSPWMKLMEERKMEKMAKKGSKRVYKTIKSEVDGDPLGTMKEALLMDTVAYNTKLEVVELLYRKIYKEEKIVNELDMKAIEESDAMQQSIGEFAMGLELYLRARPATPSSVIEYVRGL